MSEQQQEKVAEIPEPTPDPSPEPETTQDWGPPQRRRRGGSGFTGAVILIAIGSLFLLNNLGVINVDWFNLLRYWPVLLILAGLDLIISRRNPISSIIMAVVAIAAVSFIVFWSNAGSTFSPANMIEGSISVPLDDISTLEVTLNMGAFQANVNALSGGSEAASGTYETHEDVDIIVDYSTDNSAGMLVISQEGEINSFPLFNNNSFIGDMTLGLTDSVPLDLVVNAGVGDLTLDLTGLNIRSLTIEGGVGNIDIILPAEGQITLKVDMGIGNVDISVPDSMEAQVEFDGGLTTFSTSSRFEEQGDGLYTTTRYAPGASNRADIQIDSGIGSVSVK